jgi:hypothetical protein
MANQYQRITADHLEQFKELCDSGMKRQQAAASLGFSLPGIRAASKRLGYAFPRTELKDRVSLRLSEIQKSYKSQAYWAKEFGVTPPAIQKVFKSLNITAGNVTYKRGPYKDFHKHISEYRKILGYVQENGGYITEAIRTLGLNTISQNVRNFAREIGFKFRHYQFAWQEYGLWMTIPGHWRRLPPANYLVPAICQGCGKRSMLNLSNARHGKTKGCIQCSSSTRSFDQVRNTQTGEIYSSVMSWSKAIGVYQQYQKYRLILQKDGSVNIEGNLYELVQGETVRSNV